MSDAASNPFDDLDEAAPDSLAPGPDPSFVERFSANFEQASRTGTLLGATRDALLPESETGRADFDGYYEALPGWQTWDEGIAALSGQLAGTMTGLENYIPIGAGVRLVGALEKVGSGIFARILAGATDAAISNLVIDSSIQGIEIASDRRGAFDFTQLGASVLLGTAIGGAAGPLTHRGVGAAPDAAPSPIAPAAQGDDALQITIRPEGPEPAPEAPAAGAETPLPAERIDAPAETPEVAPEAPDLVQPEASPDQATAIADDAVNAPPAADDAAAAPDVPLEDPPAIGEQLQEMAESRVRGEDPPPAMAADQPRDPAIRSARDRGPQRPTRLVEFLARNGGLLDENGELSILDAGRVFVPRAGRLVRRNGMKLDTAREAAAEAGFFSPMFGSPEDAVSRTTIRDFLDLLEEDMRFKNVYRERDLPAYEAWERHQAQGERKHQVKVQRRELDKDPDFAAQPEALKQRATEIMVDERIEIDDALERAIMEEYYGGEGIEIPRRGNDELPDDIPFDDAPAQLDVLDSGSPRERGSDGREGGGSGDGRDAARPLDQDGERPSGGSGDEGSETGGGGTRAARQLGAGAKRPASGIASAADEPPTFTRLKSIAERLRDLIAVPAVRQGRLQIKRAAGTYNFDNGALRIARQDDFDTFTHEVGHAVQARFGGLSGAGPNDLAPLMRKFSAELEPIAYVGADPRHKLEEGFAEWFRLLITTERQAQDRAPLFDAAFRIYLQREAPEMLPAIEEIRAAFRAWITQPSGRAVQSTIAPGRRPGWWRRQAQSMRRYGLGATIADNLEGAYTAFFDNLHPLQRSVRALAKVAAERQGKPLDLKVIDDPYKLARLSRNAQGAGHMDIMHGVVPYRGTQPASASLRDAIVEAMSAPNALARWDDAKGHEFGAYLWSRRALGEWERFERGEIPNQPDKLTKGDHELHVREAEAANPQFVDAAAKVHEWALALWEKKLAAGLITPEQHAQGLAIRDYVPGLRAFDYDGDPAGAVSGSRSGDAKGGYVRRFKGSTRDVINPLESMMMDAYETASAIARNDVVKALDRLARNAGHGSAAIAERIPAKQMRMLLVDTLEVVEAAGKQAGMDAADVIALRDMVEAIVGDEPARIFRPAVINTKGETIVFFRDGGELRALRLADRNFGLDMYKAMTAMSPPEKNLFLDVASISSSAFRVGITSDPQFILANLIRDQAMAAIFYGSPFKRIVNTFRGIGDELLSRDAARRYNAAGGIMGGQEVAALQTGAVERDLAALKRKGWAAQRFAHKNPVELLKGLMEVSEISETGMRLGLFRSFYDEASKRGLADWEATVEAAWRARDHMDFGRRGSQMAAMSRLVPFLNASLQGFDKVSREMIAPFFGRAVTTAEAGARGNAVKAWARLAGLTVAGLSLHALMRKYDDYQELSPTTRATHWMVKFGDEWRAIPKPFEMAVVLNAAEAAWDAWAEADPLAASRYLDGVFDVLMPPNLLEGIPGAKFYFEAKTNTDLFTGRAIVPPYLEGLEPWMQYTASTSAISRTIGKAIDVPPVMVDQFITTQFATVGRSVMALSDMASGDKPRQGWDEFFLTRRFAKRASRGSTSSSQFWDMISQSTGTLEGAAKSYKALRFDAGDEVAAADYLATLPADKKAYVIADSMGADVRRLHPMVRARLAVQAIGHVRRDISSNRLRDADGNPVEISSADRGTVDDILADLAMVEARNALIAIGERGWTHIKQMDPAGYLRELEAVSPAVMTVLADRYATNTVWERGTIERNWPELRQRLLDDQGDADTRDLEIDARSGGTELDGTKLKKKKKPRVPGRSDG